MSDLRTLLHDRHVIVCCGPGGVGKTTSAAAIALRAAEEGRTAIVCTIDPARRLAQALGLTELDNTPKLVEVPAARGRKARGELWAMMLDTKRTFDEMVLGMTTPDRAQRIFENPFYRHVSSTLSGTQEYMAMEKLFELHEEGRWHLIVIDTPPTRNALDFLDAPTRITDFLDSRFLRTLLWPTLAAGRSTFHVMNIGARAMLKVATRITGSELLSDVASFFQAFDGMYGQFKARAQRVRELLAAKRTAFVVVSTPQSNTLREAQFFLERLRAERMPIGGLLLNRTHDVPALLDDPADVAERAAKAGNAELLTAALQVYARWVEISQREHQLVAATLGDPPAVPVWKLPDLTDEITTVAGLRTVGDALMGPPERQSLR